MWFRAFGQQIRGKLREEDGSTKRIRALLDSLDEATADVAALSHGLIGKPRWAVFSIASTCATAAFALRFGDEIAQRPVFYNLDSCCTAKIKSGRLSNRFFFYNVFPI